MTEQDAPVAAFVQVQCTDMEDYARIFNEGYDEATSQLGGELATAKAEALREAAAEQRRMAAESRTNNGEAEHTDIADWLEERAEEVAGSEPDLVALDYSLEEIAAKVADVVPHADLDGFTLSERLRIGKAVAPLFLALLNGAES